MIRSRRRRSRSIAASRPEVVRSDEGCGGSMLPDREARTVGSGIAKLTFPRKRGPDTIARLRRARTLAESDRKSRISALMHRRWRSLCAWLAVCAGFSGCATMRRDAPEPGSPAVHGRLRLHRGRLEAGRSTLSARAARSEQAAGRPLPRARASTPPSGRSPTTISPRSWPRAATRSTSSTSGARARTAASGRLDRINRALRADALPRARRASWNVDDLMRVRRAGDPRLRPARDGARSASTGSATAWAGC